MTFFTETLLTISSIPSKAPPTMKRIFWYSLDHLLLRVFASSCGGTQRQFLLSAGLCYPSPESPRDRDIFTLLGRSYRFHRRRWCLVLHARCWNQLPGRSFKRIFQRLLPHNRLRQGCCIAMAMGHSDYVLRFGPRKSYLNQGQSWGCFDFCNSTSVSAPRAYRGSWCVCSGYSKGNVWHDLTNHIVVRVYWAIRLVLELR